MISGRFHLTAASREATLGFETLDVCFGHDHPARLIRDTAYNSDPLDEQLAAERTLDDRSKPDDSCKDAGRSSGTLGEAAVSG